MNVLLAAMADGPRSWGFVDFAKAVIIVIAIVAVVYVACRAMGIAIPQWLIQIAVIVVVAFVAIFAISLLATM